MCKLKAQSRVGRTLVCFLALVLYAWPLAGFAEMPGSLPVDTLLYDAAQELQGIAVVDDQVVLLSQQHLYRWRHLEEHATELASQQPFDIDWQSPLTSVLLSEGQQLWRLERMTGRLQQLTVQGDTYTAAPPVQLDWRVFADDQRMPDRVWLLDGALWMLEEVSEGMQLFRCALEPGAKPQRLKIRDVYALAKGPNGIVALQYDAAEGGRRLAQGADAPPAVLGLLDAPNETVAPITQVDIGPRPNPYLAAILLAGDTTYVGAGDTVWRIAEEGRQAVAVLPDANFLNPDGTSLWAMGEDQLLLAGKRHVLIRSRRTDNLVRTQHLRISQNILPEARASEQVAIALGDTALVVSEGLSDESQEALATAFLLGEVHNDVLVLDDSAFDLPNLGNKGYLMDLSSSQVLRAYAEGLDEKLKPLLWQEGKLVMVPFRVSLGVPSMHASALQAAGLSVPGDFLALCGMIDRFDSENLQNAAGHNLLPAGNTREALIRLGISMFFQHAHARGGALSFDDPLFRDMMQRAERVRQDAGTGEDEYPILNLYNSLDGSWWQQQEGDYPRAFDFVGLSVAPGQAPVVPAYLTMLAVNSRTPLPDAAIRCVEAIVQTISPRTLLLLTPGYSGPIPNPDYAHDRAQEEQSLRQFEQIAESARDKGTRDIYRQEADAVRQRLNEHENLIQYLEGADTVALARAIADHMQPQTGLMYSQWQKAMAELVHQYAQGAIDIEQFIRQADNRLHLVTQEHQ